MSFDRRDFLKAVGAASMVVGFTTSCGTVEEADQQVLTKPVMDVDEDSDVRHSDDVLDHEKAQWVLINADSTVSAFTGRSELGQGSRTVLTSAIAQGIRISRKAVDIHMGDTDLCPDNGPTSGSSMTINVVWPFYVACQRIRDRLLNRAGEKLGVSREKLTIQDGSVFSEDGRSLAIGEIKFDDVVVYHIGPGNDRGVDEYEDPGIGNLYGPEIVTGKLKYVGDLFPENVKYGGFVPHPYHFRGLKMGKPNFRKARKTPGVIAATRMGRQIGVVAESFSALQRGIKAVEVDFIKPKRPVEYNPEAEIRAKVKLDRVIEDIGDPESILEKANKVFSETYMTHHTTHCPIETDTAVVKPGKENERWTAWVSSQYPHMQREKVAEKIKRPLDDIHVIGMPVGGGYGGKISNPITRDTALMAEKTGQTIKGIYNRQNQFQQYCRMKDIVVLDFKTAVDNSGKLMARTVDIMQDAGHGIGKVYKCDHSAVKHYRMRSNHLRAVIRGTSYVQSIFGLESHMDEVARQIGMDPLEFRLKNLEYDAHKQLLQRSAERIGYGSRLPADTGIGMAVVNHGSDELGGVMVRVHVNRKTGEPTVEKICGTFDIGLVMNQRTCRMGIEGCYVWAIGYALLEQLKVDGHGIRTTSMWNYDVPRFEHLPEMEIDFLKVHPRYGGPRGTGEMPMVPVIAAIGNAIRDAVGVRVHKLPYTAERISSLLTKN